jgi:hypothetical protein
VGPQPASRLELYVDGADDTVIIVAALAAPESDARTADVSVPSEYLEHPVLRVRSSQLIDGVVAAANVNPHSCGLQQTSRHVSLARWLS